MAIRPYNAQNINLYTGKITPPRPKGLHFWKIGNGITNRERGSR